TRPAVKNGWMPDGPAGLWVINSIGVISHHGHRLLLAVLSSGQPSQLAGIRQAQAAARAAAAAITTTPPCPPPRTPAHPAPTRHHHHPPLPTPLNASTPCTHRRHGRRRPSRRAFWRSRPPAKRAAGPGCREDSVSRLGLVPSGPGSFACQARTSGPAGSVARG